MNSARSLQREGAAVDLSWPRGVSHDPKFRIGEVVDRLSREFRSVTVSKLRYLEKEGLIKPYRTATDMRKYSEADIERLRYCLVCQRDSHLPLRVIKSNLVQMDAGYEVDTVPKARVVSSGGELVDQPKVDEVITVNQLMDMTGVSREHLEELVTLGLVSPDLGGRFNGRHLQIIQLAMLLTELGIPTRNLRSVRLSAERVAESLEQVFGYMPARTGADKEKRAADMSEAAELAARLHTELLRQAVDTI